MDDDREAPINPYQSPRSDLPTKEEAASPERVFGLREPIRMQGKLTAEDVRQKNLPEVSGKAKAAAWVVGVAVGVAVFVADASWAHVLLGLIVLFGFVVFPAWLLAAWSTRTWARDVERNAVWQTTTFTDERIVAEGEHGRGVFRWSAFCQCQCSDQKVVLYQQPGGENLVCPRRFFGREKDWATFLGLVRSKLPEDEQSARRLTAARTERLAGLAPGAERAFEAPDREGRRPLVRVDGAISWEDWKHVQKLVGRPWLSRTVRAGCLLPFVIAGVVLIASSHGTSRMWVLLGCLAVAALFVLYALFVLPTAGARSECKRRERRFAPFEVRVWAEGVEFAGRLSAVMICWPTFAGFTLSHRALLLHQTWPSMIRFIPRAFFTSEEEWQALLRLVREKVPEE
jgi:hypothetical protein